MKRTIYTFKEIQDLLKKLDPARHEEIYFWDDKSDGLMFANMFSRVRFNASTDHFSVFNGVNWVTDDGDLMTEGLAQRFATALYLYAAPLDKDQREYYQRFGRRGTRLTMLKEARNVRAVKMEDFDRDKYLLNLQNGTLELRTLGFREHREEDLLSCVANVSYDPEVDCPLFKKFIAEVTSSPDENGIMREDPDKAEYLQRVLGYSLIGDCREDEFYLLYGSTTRNGKSTLLSVIGDLLGDYAAMIEPDALAQGRRVNQNDEQIADLRGKRFAHVEEPSKSMIFDTGLIKKLTGRSKLSASRKFEHRVEYFPEFKIFLASNYLPTVLDDTLFKSGRCKVITFDRHFEEAEQDKDLRQKLKAEGPGILNWMLEGLRNYYDKRTTPPAAVIRATEDYRQTSDRVENFLRECTDKVEGELETLSNLYKRYTEWCEASGYSPEGKSKFSDALKRKQLLINHKKYKGVEYRNVIMNTKIISDRDWIPVHDEETPFSLN